jgi:hypothetical protein
MVTVNRAVRCEVSSRPKLELRLAGAFSSLILNISVAGGGNLLPIHGFLAVQHESRGLLSCSAGRWSDMVSAAKLGEDLIISPCEVVPSQMIRQN